MADEKVVTTETTNATEAASSPAAGYTQENYDSLTEAQRTEFKKTGNMPEPASTPGKETAEAAKTVKSAAESATANGQEPSPGEDKTTKRFQQLNDQAKAEKARADRLERELQEARTAKEPAKVIELKTTPEPTRPKPTAQDKKADGTQAYSSWEELNEALIDWKVEQREAARTVDTKPLKEAVRAEMTEAEQQRAAAEQNRLWNEKWTSDTAETVKKHPDFPEKLKAVTVSEFTPEGKPIYDPERVQFEFNGAIDVYVMHSPNCQEMIYQLASNPEEITRIQAIRDPYAAARELALLETKWFGTPGEKKVTPAPKITKAGDPFKPVAGTNTAPEDEEEAALAAGDMAKYKRLANARDERALKKG
jgi:hypothetical protein